MRIFDNLLEKALSEAVEWIDYYRGGHTKKGKIYVDATPETFIRCIRHAIQDREVIAGLYIVENGVFYDIFYLWDRDITEHARVIEELNLDPNDRGKFVGFYLTPIEIFDENGIPIVKNEWCVEISGFSSTMARHKGKEILLNHNMIKEVIKLSGENGLKYLTDDEADKIYQNR